MDTNHSLMNTCLRLSIEVEALINTDCDSAIFHDARTRLRNALIEINRSVSKIIANRKANDGNSIAYSSGVAVRFANSKHHVAGISIP